MYQIIIKRQAKKKLESINPKNRIKIVDAINLLGHDPDSNNLDVKALLGQRLYRLRVGTWRVIFDRHETLKIISIEKIGPRGDIYK